MNVIKVQCNEALTLVNVRYNEALTLVNVLKVSAEVVVLLQDWAGVNIDSPEI